MNASVSWNEQKAKIETNCTKLFGTEVWSKGRRKDEQRHRDTHLGGCGAGAGVGATAGAGGTTRLGLAISSPAPKMKCIYVNLTSHPPNLSLVKSELGLSDEADTYWTCSFSNPVTWKETTWKCKKSKTGNLKVFSYLDPTFFHPCVRISNKTKKDDLSSFILFFLKLPSVFGQSKDNGCWRSEAELRLNLIRLHSVTLHMSGHDLRAWLARIPHFGRFVTFF